MAKTISKSQFYQTPWLGYNGQQGEIVDPVSLTVPDNTLTMREIVDRYTSNQPLTGVTHRTPVYDEGKDPLGGIHLKNWDMAELEALQKATTDRIKEQKDEIYREKVKKDLAKRERDRQVSRRGQEYIEFKEQKREERKQKQSQESEEIDEGK